MRLMSCTEFYHDVELRRDGVMSQMCLCKSLCRFDRALVYSKPDLLPGGHSSSMENDVTWCAPDKTQETSFRIRFSTLRPTALLVVLLEPAVDSSALVLCPFLRTLVDVGL